MYRTALNNLERISEEIHSKRNSQALIKLPPREPGVGSDKPDEFIELPDLELTEFPKIDVSDDEDETEKHNDDEILSNSINSSLSIDELSLNNNNNSGTSNIQQTSDYESFADCMRQSPIIATATANITRHLTNINFDNYFSIQSAVRVNGEGSSVSNNQQRQRRNGTSSTTVIRKNA